MSSSINVPGTTEMVIKHVWAFQWAIKADKRKQALGELSQVPDANSNVFTKLCPQVALGWNGWWAWDSQLWAGTEALLTSISSAWWMWYSQVSGKVTSAHWHARACFGKPHLSPWLQLGILPEMRKHGQMSVSPDWSSQQERKAAENSSLEKVNPSVEITVSAELS